MIKKFSSNEARIRRHLRIRKKISGTAAVPRLNVFRSNAHIYAQVIDDASGRTLAAASTVEKDFKAGGTKVTKKEEAKKVGLAVAKKAAAAGVKQVVFDRGGYQYHGRVKELADGAREGGLEF